MTKNYHSKAKDILWTILGFVFVVIGILSTGVILLFLGQLFSKLLN